MGTKNSPGDYDCYESAEPDEPMFVLLGRDPQAATLVRRWARKYKARKLEEGAFDARTEAKFNEARQCAAAMDAYRENTTGDQENQP